MARRRQRVGMQFRVSARQPTTVRALWRRFVGQRREWQDLGASIPPGVEHVRVDKAEGPIVRQCNALTGGRQKTGVAVGTRAQGDWRGSSQDRIKIKVAFGHRSEAVNQRSEIGTLGRLYQAEMPLRQCKRGVAWQRAETGKPERADCIGNERAVRSAVAPRRPALADAPSNRPMTPSIIRISAPSAARTMSASSSESGMAQLSRLTTRLSATAA